MAATTTHWKYLHSGYGVGPACNYRKPEYAVTADKDAVTCGRCQRSMRAWGWPSTTKRG